MVDTQYLLIANNPVKSVCGWIHSSLYLMSGVDQRV